MYNTQAACEGSHWLLLLSLFYRQGLCWGGMLTLDGWGGGEEGRGRGGSEEMGLTHPHK